MNIETWNTLVRVTIPVVYITTWVYFVISFFRDIKEERKENTPDWGVFVTGQIVRYFKWLFIATVISAFIAVVSAAIFQQFM